MCSTSELKLSMDREVWTANSTSFALRVFCEVWTAKVYPFRNLAAPLAEIAFTFLRHVFDSHAGQFRNLAAPLAEIAFEESLSNM